MSATNQRESVGFDEKSIEREIKEMMSHIPKELF